jgi:hypothetical protein
LRLGGKRTVQVVAYRRVAHSGLCWSRSSDNSSSRLGTWSGGDCRRGAAQATHQRNDNPVNLEASDLNRGVLKRLPATAARDVSGLFLDQLQDEREPRLAGPIHAVCGHRPVPTMRRR